MNKKYYWGLIIILLGIITYYFLFRLPPKIIDSGKLDNIKYIQVNNEKFILNEEDLSYWNGLTFERLSSRKGIGNTEDVFIELVGENESYVGIYFESKDFIYFSFGDKFKYGFLAEPTPGGWNKPIYFIKKDDKLLKFLHIEK